MTRVYLRHVRDLGFRPGEGHLYSHDGRHYLVYCGQNRTAWDACETDPAGDQFSRLLVDAAPSREDALIRLRRRLHA